MTTICNFPIEVLSLVFEQLSTSDLLQCQRACPVWYSPAHTLLLKVINLRASQVQMFISSIDSNPCLKYLQAVKELHISTSLDFSYSKDDVYKLLFRFPNLTKVKLIRAGVLLAEFTDDMCKELLQKCPKLDQFEADCSCIAHTRDVLYKVRLLVTTIDFFHLGLRDQNAVQYLTSFPRLQKINGRENYFNSYQQLLQILQQLVNLKDIALIIYANQDHLVERYFATITQDKRDILINRLSNITRFHVKCHHNVCINSMLLTKYLTGLESFMMDITCSGEDWTDQEEQVFINSLDLVCKYTGKIDLYRVRHSNCKRYLPIIEDNILTPGSIFRLRIGDPEYTTDGLGWLNISVESNHYKKQLTIAISSDLILAEFTPEIPELHKITELEVLLDEENMKFGKESSTFMYEELLEKFPMVEKVSLDIPDSYRDYSYNIAYPLVEELRLQIYSGIEFYNIEGVLSRFTIMFPNLQHLDLYDFAGKWEQDSKEFHVDLSNYSLQNLTMNFTPVRAEISVCLNKDEFDDQDFYVVELIRKGSPQKHLYKLTLKSLSSKHINESDLQNCTDYIRVKISIDSLQRFVIYFSQSEEGMCNTNLANYMQKTYDGRLLGPIPHITLFENSD